MSALLQNTPEWHALRKTKIGASDAPIIMEVSPWKTPYQLWQEKLGFVESQFTSRAMQRGLDMEEQARRSFEEHSGLIVIPQVLFHPEYKWMMASLDGMTLEGDAMVEIKCPGQEDHATAVNGEVPKKYIPQLQHQLAVSGLDMVFYYSFDGVSGACVEVIRDDDYIARLIYKEREFWECVQTLDTPKMVDRDFVEQKSDLWVHAASEWQDIHKKLEELKDREQELRTTLICMASNKNSRGAGVRLSKVVRKGAIDYKLIPQLHDVEVEKFRKAPVETWRLSNC